MGPNTHLLADYFVQVTPGLGVVAVLLVLLVLREPQRGVSDGHRNSKGVKGKSGFSAYGKDIAYLIMK